MNTAAFYKLNRQNTRLDCYAYDLKAGKVMLRPPVTEQANKLQATDHLGRFYPKHKCGGQLAFFGSKGKTLTIGCYICLKCGAEEKAE